MKIEVAAFAVLLTAFSTPFSYARCQGIAPPTTYANSLAATLAAVARQPLLAVTSESSSNDLPDAPETAEIRRESKSRVVNGLGPSTRFQLYTRPFSSISAGMTVGLGGLGFQAATPLAAKINLRGGFSFLNFNPSMNADGIPIQGQIKLRSASLGVDFFPYRNTFHITPGLTMYNGNHMTATSAIAPGQIFSVNDDTYTNSITDPVRGVFDVHLGRKVAPSLTVGFGNMLPRKGSAWSVPVDFGVEYAGTPKATLTMAGTVCDPVEGCYQIQFDPGSMANLAQEQVTINHDIAPLRFYPIFSMGLSYRFGRKVKTSNWQ